MSPPTAEADASEPGPEAGLEAQPTPTSKGPSRGFVLLCAASAVVGGLGADMAADRFFGEATSAGPDASASWHELRSCLLGPGAKAGAPLKDRLRRLQLRAVRQGSSWPATCHVHAVTFDEVATETSDLKAATPLAPLVAENATDLDLAALADALDPLVQRDWALPQGVLPTPPEQEAAGALDLDAPGSHFGLAGEAPLLDHRIDHIERGDLKLLFGGPSPRLCRLSGSATPRWGKASCRPVAEAITKPIKLAGSIAMTAPLVFGKHQSGSYGWFDATTALRVIRIRSTSSSALVVGQHETLFWAPQKGSRPKLASLASQQTATYRKLKGGKPQDAVVHPFGFTAWQHKKTSTTLYRGRHTHRRFHAVDDLELPKDLALKQACATKSAHVSWFVAKGGSWLAFHNGKVLTVHPVDSGFLDAGTSAMGSLSCTAGSARITRIIAGKSDSADKILQQQCREQGCDAPEKGLLATGVSGRLAAPFGDDLFVLASSKTGGWYSLQGALADLHKAPPRYLFDDAEHGGYSAENLTYVTSDQGDLLILGSFTNGSGETGVRAFNVSAAGLLSAVANGH